MAVGGPPPHPPQSREVAAPLTRLRFLPPPAAAPALPKSTECPLRSSPRPQARAQRGRGGYERGRRERGGGQRSDTPGQARQAARGRGASSARPVHPLSRSLALSLARSACVPCVPFVPSKPPLSAQLPSCTFPALSCNPPCARAPAASLSSSPWSVVSPWSAAPTTRGSASLEACAEAVHESVCPRGCPRGCPNAMIHHRAVCPPGGLRCVRACRHRLFAIRRHAIAPMCQWCLHQAGHHL